MKFTRENKVSGEFACRHLSARAKRFYNETDPLAVYEVDGLFYVRGAFEYDALTFSEMESEFEAIQEEIDSSDE